jgi:hypothetical protein
LAGVFFTGIRDYFIAGIYNNAVYFLHSILCIGNQFP